MEGFKHDLIKKSKSTFDYQDSGNYNSEIMKFLNYLISLPNKIVNEPQKQKENSLILEDRKGKPLNELFFEEVENLFKMV